MSRKKSPILTDHELLLMDVVWQMRGATVAQVVEGLLPIRLAYTTVLTTLRTLEQKGYVRHKEAGRAYVYSAVIGRDGAARIEVGRLIKRFFSKSPGSALESLLQNVRLTEEDIAKINEILLQRRRGPEVIEMADGKVSLSSR